MKKKNIVVIALILLGVTGFNLYAEVISEIRIQGDLRKTRESTILKIIETEPGDIVEYDDVENIRQKLLRSGLFIDEKVHVALQPEGGRTVLILDLEDRFSLIPLPFFVYTDGRFSAGGFLMESNLLGTGNRFFAGGMYGGDMAFLSASYMQQRFLNSPLDVGFGVAYMDQASEAEDTRGNTAFTESAWSLGGSFFSRLDFTPFSLGFSLSSGFREVEASALETGYFSPGIGFEYDGQHIDEYFRKGIKGAVEYEHTFYSREFSQTEAIDFSLFLDFLPHPRILVSTAVEGMVFSGDDLLSPQVNSPLISSLVHADRQAQASLKMSPVIADFSWGFLALPVGYQVGILDGVSSENEIYHGPWGGVMLYLKKVTIPALSLRYGTNLETGNSQYSFSMGFQG